MKTKARDVRNLDAWRAAPMPATRESQQADLRDGLFQQLFRDNPIRPGESREDHAVRINALAGVAIEDEPREPGEEG